MANIEQLHAGFGKASLWGTWQTENKLADEIDVRVMVARQGQNAAAVAVADFCSLWPGNCMKLRDAVAATVNIPSDCIGVFSTQNHGTPVGDDAYVMDKVQHAFVTASKQANEQLQPAEVAHIAVRPDPPLTFHRRITLDDIGTFTFWFGFDINESSYPHSHNLLNSALAMLADGHAYQFRCPFSPGSGTATYTSDRPHLKIDQPLPLEPAEDDLLQGIFFRTPEGKPIGSLIRIATHPAAANARGADWHSGDFPVYVRRRVEAVFGGTGLYLNGPCGNQASAVDEKSLDMANHLGTQIADAALSELDQAQWQPNCQLSACTLLAEMTVRSDYPADADDARRRAEQLEADIKTAAAHGKPLGEIKQLSDQWEKLLYLNGMHKNWTGLDYAGRAGQTIQHPIFTLRLGQTIITGLPGEPFAGYSTRIRHENPDANIIIAEQGNGYLGYLPTKTDYHKGGYGPNAMIFAEDTEDVLTNVVKKAVERTGC